MSSAATSRTTRRRVLVVGDTVVKGADDSLNVRNVANVFAALGELATCPARSPIEALVIAAPSTHRLPDLLRGVDAVKRLEPMLQIIAVAPGLPLPALEGRVDLQVEPDLHITQIKAMLDGTGAPASDTAAPTPELDTPSETTTDRVTDRKLIDTLLHTPDRFRALLLRAVAERSGQPGARLEDGAGSDDAATVQYDGVTWGHLAGGELERLRPWAAWAASWMRLEQRMQRLSEEAMCDQLTGALNRRGLDRFLDAAVAQARAARREITVMVFDIDDFKSWNDRWGHEAGDVILKHTVRLLGSVIRDGDAVARIGGDEFVVVFADRTPPRTPGSQHPDTIESITRRFQQQVTSMKFPELGLAAPGAVSISGGLATFPWDGDDAATLQRVADERALASKRRGKNCLTFGPDAVNLD
ncbi:MAG: GGDEF domain-containing protein [Phycisphaerales bacterium]|nr:GGDEF domain-containing protein [Phycisphaerales bacterium]